MKQDLSGLPQAPLVSVVVPTYQHADFIEQCLDGILMQKTTFPIEILVGEDGSTDGTREVCKRYAAEHPERIQLTLRSRKDVIFIMGKPTGRANFMDLLNAAKGKYIALCEGDDYWTDPLKLQKQADAMEKDPSVSGVFHFTEQRFEGMEGKGQLFGSHEGKLRFNLVDTISMLALCHTGAFMYRSSGISLPHWFSKVRSADMALFAMVAGSGDLVCIPEIMSVYRKHPGGLTQTEALKGTSYHWHRILLWLYMDRHFKYRYTAQCQELFLLHWQQILWENTPRQRLQYLRELLRTIPGWFLHHPAFSLARLRECLRD